MLLQFFLLQTTKKDNIMAVWINITNPKHWFESKEQFEFVKWISQEFEAQWVNGIYKTPPLIKS